MGPQPFSIADFRLHGKVATATKDRRRCRARFFKSKIANPKSKISW
jgi:hypothetical protein